MMRQTDELLASELNKLSVKERTEAFKDIHCVGEELKDTPEVMGKALADFAVAVVVLLMKEEHKYPVYKVAVQQNRAYVENDSFRLMFLRANFYDVDKSVRQMMRFLQNKATYFGIDKVARDITLDDLNEVDMQVLQSGMWHIQDERDRSGRVIVHEFSNMHWDAENTVRAAYIVYVNIVAADLEAQRKGVVIIFHNVARSGQKIAMPGLANTITFIETYMSFPIRCSTLHPCLHQVSARGNAPLIDSFLRSSIQLLPLYETVRCRIHVGHSMEIQYQLRSHGIPLESFPVDMNGKVREDIFFAWFDKYYQQEAQRKLLVLGGDQMHQHGKSSRILQAVPMGVSLPPIVAQGNISESVPFAIAPSVTPSENDVLLGKGKFIQSWTGNVKFRKIIEEQSGDYDRLLRTERQKRTIELTRALIAQGIRFCIQDESRSGEWVEADFTQARLKVSQMFRTIRKRKPSPWRNPPDIHAEESG